MNTGKTKVLRIQYFFVCLYFASLNFEVFSPVIENFSVAKMVSLLYMGVSLLTPRELFSLERIEFPLFSIFAVFTLMVISSIIHIQINRSIFDTTFFLNIIMFWLLLNHSRRDNRVFCDGLMWFAISSFVVSVLFHFGIGSSVDNDLRMTVFGDNCNGVGIKMATSVLYLLYYCLAHTKEKPVHHPWLLLMSIPIISLLFATASRVSILILGGGAVLFVLFKPSIKKGKRILWLLISVLALWYGYKIVSEQEVLMSRMARTIEEGSLSQRDYIWAEYIELIEQYPVLGVGFSGADQYAQQVFGQAKSPHNVFVEVALYSGIIGLIPFFAFILCVFRDAWRNYKKRNIIGPFLTNMTIIGALMSGQALGVKLFWVLAAYAISYRVITITSIEKGVY